MSAGITYFPQKDLNYPLSIGNLSSARYYNSDLSIWISVDPLADKYPNLSPYTYCANNPVRMVDEDGREIGKYYDEHGKYLGADGIDDKRIYQTTRVAWNKHVTYSTASDISGAAGLVQSKYDNLKADQATNYLGETNEFGLIQLTNMGNPNIINGLHNAGFRSISGGGAINSTLSDPSIHSNHIHIDRKY